MFALSKMSRVSSRLLLCQLSLGGTVEECHLSWLSFLPAAWSTQVLGYRFGYLALGYLTLTQTPKSWMPKNWSSLCHALVCSVF